MSRIVAIFASLSMIVATIPRASMAVEPVEMDEEESDEESDADEEDSAGASGDDERETAGDESTSDDAEDEGETTEGETTSDDDREVAQEDGEKTDDSDSDASGGSDSDEREMSVEKENELREDLAMYRAVKKRGQTTLWISGIMVVLGISSLVVASSCPDDSGCSGHPLLIGTGITFVSGGVIGLGTGTAWFLYGKNKSENIEDRLSFRIVPQPDGAAGVLNVRF